MSEPTVIVRLEDLRLLLQRAEPLLVSAERAGDPVVDAIDRMGDAVYVAGLAQAR